MTGMEEAAAGALLLRLGAALAGAWAAGRAAQDISKNLAHQNSSAETPQAAPAEQNKDAGEKSQALSPGDPKEPCQNCDDGKKKNKKKHIFEKPDHNLDEFLKSFNGDQDKALEALQKAADNITPGRNGLFEGVENINGFNITIRGANVNGVNELGTAFIK